MTEICLYDRNYCKEIFEHASGFLREHPENVLYVYDDNLECENIQIGNTYYTWHIGQSVKAKKDKSGYFWVTPYTYNEEVEETENGYNAICPFCGYVDYDSWECPEGEYSCPECHSISELDRQVTIGYEDDYDCTVRLTPIKKVPPKKLDMSKLEVLNG